MSEIRSGATAIETGAIALWVGASAGFAFVSAPIAFCLVTDRDVFAQITEQSLARLAQLTYVSGGTAAAVALLRAGFENVSQAHRSLAPLSMFSHTNNASTVRPSET